MLRDKYDEKYKQGHYTDVTDTITKTVLYEYQGLPHKVQRKEIPDHVHYNEEFDRKMKMIAKDGRMFKRYVLREQMHMGSKRLDNWLKEWGQVNGYKIIPTTRGTKVVRKWYT